MENDFTQKNIHEEEVNFDTSSKERDLDILYNSIVTINSTVSGDKSEGTGFFIKLYLKNKLRYFLMTCCHIINEKYVNKMMSVIISFGKLNEKEKIEIKLDRKERYIKCFNEPLYKTLIEILEKDNIKKNKFLEPDLNYKNGYIYYNNKYINTVTKNQVNINEKEISVSSGKITKIINEQEFKYSLDNKPDIPGSPICLKNNFLVVGIHNKGSKTKYINYGIFLGYILDNIEKEEIIFKNEIEKNKSITINEEPKLEKENKEEKIKKIELVHEGINEEENKKEKHQNNKDNHSNNKVSLKNINSKYIIKMVLSYLCQKNQIKIFKYNKMVQNMMDLNLNKCKFFSGRYIEYETNIKGKEYNGYNDILIYEGGYLNGKRNGKCKEYDNYGQLIFEGEYLNGKRNGKGKEYYDNGKLLFEGNFLNGNRFTGKVYDIKGNMSYDLENMNGLIKKYYRDGKIEFEGEYLNGKKNGKGKEYNDDGNLIFEGEYLNDERNGKGKEYGDLIYKGEFLNGKKHGKGKEYFFDMVVFEGEYLNGNRWNGKGYRKNNIITYTLKNGNGHVEEYHRYNTLTFEGKYLNGKRNGKGKEYNDGKIEFEGEYLNGKRKKGIEYNSHGNIIFEGEYLNGEKNGEVKEYNGNNGELTFEGAYLNGKRNGKGKEYYSNGELKFDGEYLNNYKFKGKKYINKKLEFEGEFLFNKKWSGKGYDRFGRVIYKLNKGNGSVKEYRDVLLRFEGEYLNGKRSGKGKEYFWNNIIEFEGEYLNGERKKGKENDNEGHLIFEGEYLNNRRWNGKERQYFLNDNLQYEGEYKNGKRFGREYHPVSGNLLFEGEYLNKKRWNGKFKEYNEPIGTEIELIGEYVDGKKIITYNFKK